MTFNESIETYRARKKIKDLFRNDLYDVEEEVPLDVVTNNVGEEIFPPYRADMIATKTFIIEFDSKKLHGTKRRRIHDSWRDKNIRHQINLKTVRLFSKDILRQSPSEIMEEINYQLARQTEEQDQQEEEEEL